jgi:hypothetical protein
VNATALHPAPSPELRSPPTGRRRAVLALASVEAVRLLRHPITIAALLLLVGVWVSGWITNEANHYPVLQDADRDTQLGMMLLLGGAALIAGNLAVLRAHRNGTTALGDVLVLPQPARTAAHLLAVLPLGVLATALTVARVAVLAAAPAAGRPNAFELVTGPAIVLLFGAAGVLLGQVTRSPIAAPLTLLAVLAVLVVVPLLSTGGPAQWFQPVVPQGESVFLMPAPVHLMARPAGSHLAYLVGLGVLVAAAALALSGARAVRLVVVASAALAVTVAGGVVQTRSPSQSIVDARLAAVRHPAHEQTCQRLDRVTYCAFPDFASWIAGWDEQVRGVLRRVPTTQAQQPLGVRQRIILQGKDGSVSTPPLDTWQADDATAGTPAAVTAGTRWGDSRSAAEFAGLVAYRLVTGDRPGENPTVCGARGVLVGWLAGQASAQSNTGLRKLAHDQDKNHDGGVLLAEIDSGSGIYLPDPEITMALALLDRPANEVAARVQGSWDELAAQRTPIARAAEILGVPAPTPAAPAGEGAPKGDAPGRCP